MLIRQRGSLHGTAWLSSSQSCCESSKERTRNCHRRLDSCRDSTWNPLKGFGSYHGRIEIACGLRRVHPGRSREKGVINSSLWTPHDVRCRTPCNTRSRLAGYASVGQVSNLLARGARFQLVRILPAKASPSALQFPEKIGALSRESGQAQIDCTRSRPTRASPLRTTANFVAIGPIISYNTTADSTMVEMTG